MGTTARTTSAGAVALVLGLGLASCGQGGAGSAPADPGSSPTTADGLAPEGYDGAFEVVAQVVQGTTGGAAACVGAQSDVGLPPGARPCGGLELDGWDWEAVPHTTEPDGVRRGVYRVTGTVDPAARRMTVTARPVVDAFPPRPEDEPRFDTRCPEPTGGWVSPDPSRATFEAYQTALEVAPRVEGYAGLFVDQSWATSSDDWAATVVNVLTVGDVAATEAALREVWGGPLCVSPGIRSYTDLRAPESAVVALEGFMTGGPDIMTGQYRVDLLIAHAEDQFAMDREFGEGAVVLTGALTPVG